MSYHLKQYSLRYFSITFDNTVQHNITSNVLQKYAYWPIVSENGP